ncbi:MAG: hypothetical protein QNK23_01180 [Crocinitomicaceae bacterium]|nr:hypothetical protein [Crocinitomicaceae bacterium]
MSYKDYKAKIEFKGCRYDDGFQKQVNIIISSMEKNEGSYKGKFSLEVERDGDEVKTTDKSSSGLSDAEAEMLGKLESIAHAVSRAGGRPNKIKIEVEVEKE